MQEKRIKKLDLTRMPLHSFKMTMQCLEIGAFRLLGIFWKKRIEWFEDKNGDIVFRYE